MYEVGWALVLTRADKGSSIERVRVSLSVLIEGQEIGELVSSHLRPASQMSAPPAPYLSFLSKLGLLADIEKKCLSPCHKHWTVTLDFQELPDITSSEPDFQVWHLTLENKEKPQCKNAF